MPSFPAKPQADQKIRHATAQVGDETALYREWAPRLRRVVAGCVNTSDANLDDACSFAWAQLLRHQPRQETAFAWMVTVAKREAWRLDRSERREACAIVALTEEMPHIADDASNREALRDVLENVERLHPRRRQMLMEHASGYTFDEIAERHGINRARARALVYKARLQLAEILADAGA
jgi:RNA polymerase sigma factor (sigma-70 family)